ncbi:MAG: glucose-6-phosphate dehydrogenase [Deltaproteobacteria bacterium]
MADKSPQAGLDPASSGVKAGLIVPPTEACSEYSPPPCSMVIFGASGDLVKRKLIPALLNLFRYNILGKRFFIIGVARTPMETAAFREAMRQGLADSGHLDSEAWPRFSEGIFYTHLDYGDTQAYSALKDLIEEKERSFGTEGNRIFYLATPPTVYAPVIEALGAAGLNSSGSGWTRLVVEKPFGRDSSSARSLESVVHRVFEEDQVYRIDHYLGKDTVQNIMMLRFANSIFEPVWNRHYIDHIQITAAETLGVEKRAGYFEQSGVIRDMFQNHMLQLLTIATMEPPSLYESGLVTYERLKVLKALRPLPLDDIDSALVIGQYASGEIDGRPVLSYRDEEGVARDSKTPTYAAMKLYIDNWRWQGVPFYLRSGKRLKSQATEVVIKFRRVPHMLFGQMIQGEIGPNALILRIQPDERVQLKFHTKNPGSKMCLRDVVMDFSYMDGYDGVKMEAYERVLLDCMLGDKTLFISSEGMELSWAFLTPLLDLIDKGGPGAPPLDMYRAGGFGPAMADELMQSEGRGWRRWRDYE